MSDSPPSVNSPARVDELDGLRGLLALWVAFSHILAMTGHWECPLPRRLFGAWGSFLGAGPAVGTFIILSGFAISFLLHKRRQSYASFMRGRFFRIYPVYLFCLAASIATGFLVPFILQTAVWKETIYFDWVGMFRDYETSRFGSHLFAHLTLLNGVLTKSMLPGATGTLLPPAWSITLEWQYYLVAPFLARGIRSGTGLLLIGLIAGLGVHYSGPWQNTNLSFLPPQLPLFLIGIGSYHLYAKLSDSAEFRPLASACAAALMLTGLLSGWNPVALTIWSIGFGCIVVRGNDPFAGFLALVRRSLLHPWLQHLGKISFPLYLIHWPVIIAMLYLLLQVLPGITSHTAAAVMLATAIPVIVAAAEIIHRTIEKPGMDFGKRFDRRPAVAKPMEIPQARPSSGE